MKKDFLPKIITWFRLDEHVRRLALRVDALEEGGGDTRPYTTYTALLTQDTDQAPEAVILENSVGDIVWTRLSAGEYRGTLTGAFVNQKTHSLISKPDASAEWDAILYRINDNVMGLTTRDSFVETDSLLSETSIEIKIYN